MPNAALFSTPLSMYDLPNMEAVNRELTERLVAEAGSRPSIRRSNYGSWHSPPDLALRPDPAFRSLFQTIVARVRETAEGLAKERGHGLPPMRVGVQAWAMVMRNGDYTAPHDHGEAHWATVYYPDAGDADETRFPDSGLLELLDPRQGARQMPGLELVGTSFSAKPGTGRLFVFPAWLMHYVHPYRGERPRVAISANLTFEVATPAI